MKLKNLFTKIEKVYESNAKKAFRDQKQQMELKASVGHEASCEDMWNCGGCFKFETDKIVGKPYLVKK